MNGYQLASFGAGLPAFDYAARSAARWYLKRKYPGPGGPDYPSFEVSRRTRLKGGAFGSVTQTEDPDRRSGSMSGYTQTRRYHRRGRRIPFARYIDRVTRGALVHQIERYSAVSDAAGTLGTNRGSTFLGYGVQSTDIWRQVDDEVPNQVSIEMPIHLFNLSTTSQNPTVFGLNAGTCGWKLCLNETPLSPYLNRLGWRPNLAWLRTTTVAPDSYPAKDNSVWELEDNQTTAGVHVGRAGVLEWTDIRMLFYGKKTRPTRIKVSFVTFVQPEFSPEYAYYNDGAGFGSFVRPMDTEANEYWINTVKPLINNPCSLVKGTRHGKVLNVLSSYVVNIEPKETTEADTDPNQKFHKWFNRWNRRIDYSIQSSSQQTSAQVNDPQQYPVAVAGHSKFPRDLKGCVYLMISSYQPDEESGAFTTAQTASYDFNIRKSTGILER